MPTFGGGTLKSFNFTESWGLSPGSGTATALGTQTFTAGQDFSYTVGGKTYHGVIKNPVQQNNSSAGAVWTVSLVDNREKLAWDPIACSFNIVEIKEVDPTTFGKDRRRRYRHVLPDNWHAQIVTYTDNPLTAEEILDYIFGAETNRYDWSYTSHARLQKPVYNLDADTGTEVGSLVQQVLDKLCLMMRLSGQYELTFEVKGDGAMPTYTGPDVKEYNIGTALTNQAPAVRIVGDRDLYQDLPITLLRDWRPEWEQYLFEGAWIEAVREKYEFDYETPAERASVAAHARSITVGEWEDLHGEGLFDDYGRFGEVNRMNIPAWVYLNEIVFKAYRIDPTYKINGIELLNMKLHEQLLARVTVDAETGELSYFENEGTGDLEHYTDDKAFIAVRGQQLDLADPARRDILDPSMVTELANLWSPNQKFRLDSKNFAVIFEDAVFEPGTDEDGLFIFVNADTDLPADHPSKHLVVPNVNATFTPATAMGSFCFEVERYHEDYGSGIRKAIHYVSGLSLHELMIENAFATEIKYDTDPEETVAQKAEKAAEAFLSKKDTYESGNWKRVNSGGTTLNGKIDRVTVTLDADSGLVEDGDFTKERAPGYFESERELERRKLSDDLFTGMREARQEFRDYDYLSRMLDGMNARPNTAVYRNINDVWKTPIGNLHSAPTNFFPAAAYGAGEVLFTNDEDLPSTGGKAFQGVVVAKGCVGGQAHPVATQGVVPAKVKGPCEEGDAVGVDDGEKFAKAGGSKPIGTVLDAYTGTETVTLRVRLSAPGSAPPCPLGMYNASEGETKKLGFAWGTIAGRQPTGFSAGGVPAYTVEVSGSGYVYAKATANLASLQWTSSEIVISTNPALPNTTTEAFKLIGSFAIDAEGVMTLTRTCGNVEFTICDLPG